MDRVRGQPRRIVRPEAKRRRPPRACVQCYGRKLKCGRESPACSRCVKAGHGQECAYRGESRPDLPAPSAVPGPPVTTGEISSTLRVVAQPELLSYSSPHAQTPQPLRDERMTHLKGQGTTTRFYGCSYHLNLYQQVRYFGDTNRTMSTWLIRRGIAVSRPTAVYCPDQSATSGD
jgi:hypothetical protein